MGKESFACIPIPIVSQVIQFNTRRQLWRHGRFRRLPNGPHRGKCGGGHTTPELTSMSTQTTTKIASNLSQSYLDALLTGDRANTRRVIEAALNNSHSAFDLLNGLIWPTMELLQALYRDDR